MTTLLKPEERVLATLNADGSRRWLKPKLARGKMWHRRRIVGYALIAFFVSLPHFRVNGDPLVLLNIVDREFTLFGKVFLPTDTLLLALTMMTIFISVFLLTALFGRVWCGWGCPQTVYMEFVFRPIERLFEAKKNRKGFGGWMGRRPAPLRKALQYVVYLVVCVVLANTFLSYFVRSDTVFQWMTQAPWAHPTGFIVVALTVAAMMFDFAFFREQLCLVACPYGRFQSVMLDKNSVIVGYDYNRGEPRGRPSRARRRRKAASPPIFSNDSSGVHLRVLETSAAEPRVGDCIDCEACVAVCPTGIDIRDGLQLECINCAQCIDACDDVMRKMKRPEGLIRYTSQNSLERGRWSFFRPRVAIYPALLAILLTAIVLLIGSKSSADVFLTRAAGMPFYVLPSGDITNQATLRVRNRTGESREYFLRSSDVEVLNAGSLQVAAGEQIETKVLLSADPSLFVDADGQRVVTVNVSDGEAFSRDIRFRLRGPVAPVLPEAGGRTPAGGATVPETTNEPDERVPAAEERGAKEVQP